MQSLFTRTKSFLSQAPTTGFRTEKDASQLFPATLPEIDGEDCLHDCASCNETLPRKWSIDEDDKLYGHVNGWATHLIVGTGKSDWVRDVTDEKGSIMEAVGKLGVELENGKLMLSASNMPSSEDPTEEGQTTCIVLPQWKVVESIGPSQTEWLLSEVIAKGSTNSSPLQGQVDQTKNGTGESREEQTNGSTQMMQQRIVPSNVPEGIRVAPLQHRAIILMCSHGTRDWRCGKSAPLLKRELERHLRPLGLQRDFGDSRPGGVGIYFINHVGGHKYSANVMIYRRCGSGQQLGESTDEAVQGIWLARVRPEDCENIVRYTVLQGKLVKPQRQLRGGFDRERGVLSW